MRFENPRESGPVFLVTGLYAAVIDVGFHVEAPPLAPASLLIVALSLIILGHLLNLYQVAKDGDYPGWAYGVEFLILATVAWMFKLLAHPVLGGAASFLPFPLADYGADAAAVAWRGGNVPTDQQHELFRVALNRTFSLSFGLVVLLFVWHQLVKWHNRDRLWLKDELLYFVGWAVMLLFGLGGLCLTRSEPASEDSYKRVMGWLEGLALVAVVFSTTFLVAAKWTDA